VSWLAQVFSGTDLLVPTNLFFWLCPRVCPLPNTISQMIVLRALQGLPGRADPDGLTRSSPCCRRRSSRSASTVALSATFAPGDRVADSAAHLTENVGLQLSSTSPGAGVLPDRICVFARRHAPMKLSLLAAGRRRRITMAIV